MELVIVTGCEGLIGKAITQSLLDLKQYLVVGFDISEKTTSVGENFLYVSGSVNSKEDIHSLKKVVQDNQNKFKVAGVKGIINCFVAPDYSFKDEVFAPGSSRHENELDAWRNYPAEDFEMQLIVNVVGIHNILTILFETYSESIDCSIINFASQYGKRPPKFSLFRGLEKFTFKAPAYGASKSSVENYSRYLSVLFEGTGIRVNCISPGNLMTTQSQEFIEKYIELTVTKRMMKVDEVVDPILYLLSSQSSYFNGTTIEIDGGWGNK
ncbi:FabG Dehydrogenases with different specificities (related to short-chain alcohol dehydrogenases) [Candidatus Nanopelagicaceae bacterium]